MKRIVMALILLLSLATYVFALDLTGWKFSLKQIDKNADKVRTIVKIITPESYAFGREIVFPYSEVETLTLVQFRDYMKAKVEYLIEQEYDEYLLRKKIESILNIEVNVQ